MTGKDRNFRNHKANTRNTRIRKSKLSQKAGAIFSPLLSNIKQWDTSSHFKSSEEHFIFEKVILIFELPNSPSSSAWNLNRSKFFLLNR